MQLFIVMCIIMVASISSSMPYWPQPQTNVTYRYQSNTGDIRIVRLSEGGNYYYRQSSYDNMSCSSSDQFELSNSVVLFQGYSWYCDSWVDSDYHAYHFSIPVVWEGIHHGDYRIAGDRSYGCIAIAYEEEIDTYLGQLVTLHVHFEGFGGYSDLPPDYNLHEEYGPVRDGDYDLIGVEIEVAADQSTWSSVKRMYR